MDIDSILQAEMTKDSVFKDANIMSAHYTPDQMPHRENEIKRITKTLAPALSKQRVSNLIVYGKTGTGKTSTIRNVINKLNEFAKKNNSATEAIHMNCRACNTKYRLLVKCLQEFYPDIAQTGWSASVLYDKLLKKVDEMEMSLIIVLDEIDMVHDLSDTMYLLSRSNDQMQKGRISVVGITNNLIFKENIDPRTKSSLCEDEMIFPPYNAEQIKDILLQRVPMAFKENVVQDAALSLASAYAAQSNGDARYALRLIKKAGEMADELEEKTVTDTHVKMAKDTVEEDIIEDVIITLPEHQQVVLYALADLNLTGGEAKKLLSEESIDMHFSGEVYNKYVKLCKHLFKQEPRTTRWFREYLNELEMLGLVTINASGKGIRGHTRLVRLGYPAEKIKKILDEKLKLDV